MKKTLALVLACAMALGLVACGGSASSAPAASKPASSAAAAGESYKVYLITMDQMDQHWVNVNAGCQAAVKELADKGVKIDYTWSAPDVKDDAKQIELINNAVADGAQALLLAANGPDAVTSALQEAADAGVKIIYVDSPANFDAEQTLATDNKAAGSTAGTELIKALKDAGTTSGKIGIVSVNTATASTVAREEGFRAAFDGTDFELLETQYCDGDASRSQDAATNFIAQGCVGLFGANEGSTVGVGNAIKEDGSGKIIGAGFDKSDAILTLIKDGHLLCTMAQNPDVMGHDGMMTAAEVLAGTFKGEANVDTGVTVVTKELA